MTEPAMGQLDREIAAYDEMKAHLERNHMGKFVVVHDAHLIGSWDTLDAAAQEAVRRFGKGPYLIRRAGDTPQRLPASVFMRPIRPPHATV